MFYRTLQKTNLLVIKNPIVINVKDDNGKVIGKRKIQYSEEYNTIDYNEQIKIDKNVKATPIAFRKMMLKTYDNPTLEEFLNTTSQNKDNGGNLFRLVDVEKEAEYQLQEFEVFDTAINFLNKSTQKQIKALAIWFLGNNVSHKKTPELKLLLRRRCQADINFAKAINDFKEDDNKEIKLVIASALSKGIIKQFANKIIDGETDSRIFVSSDTKTVLNEYAVWLTRNKQGKENLDDIIAKLK